MKSSSIRKAVVASLLSLPFWFASPSGVSQNKYFAGWPEGADPRVVGDRVAQRFLESPHQEAVVMYPEVCIWYGSLAYADVVGDMDLRAKLQARFQPLLTPEGKQLIPDKEHLDYEIFGVVPL